MCDFRREFGIPPSKSSSRGARALGGGWGGAALKGREDQRRQDVRMQGEGQFPEEAQAVKGVRPL